MCKFGDIIVIKEFRNENNQLIPKHSFVVISDHKDSIEGLEYDFVSNMMCSFHDDDHKRKKLSHRENIKINPKDIIGTSLNPKEGYIKSDQLYYFNKNKIDYKVIAHMSNEMLDKLVKLILKMHQENNIKTIITNL